MRYFGVPTANLQVADAAPDVRYYGYNAQEVAGVAGSIIIHHGTVVGDPVLATITLAANESVNDWPEEGGVAAPNGIFVEHVSGSIEIGLYWRNA